MLSKTALIILDGRGMTTDIEKSATAAAHTPFIDSLYNDAPFCQLQASEEAVGLPMGQVGNSEVGHSTIGSGRVNYQDLVLINKTITEDKLRDNQNLIDAIQNCKTKNQRIHLLCLLSDAGVHAHIDHLFAIGKTLNDNGLSRFAHGFTDGRDSDPQSGLQYIDQVEQFCNDNNGQLVSIIGRYYGMDRNRRMDKTKLAYDLLVHGIGETTEDFISSLQKSYNEGITDEYLLPHIKKGSEHGCIQEGDTVIFVNYRNDRPKQLTEALTQSNYPELDMKKLDIAFYSMTEYDPTYIGIKSLFPKTLLKNTIGEVISKEGLAQLRISETEKYAHVTFFLNGGQEDPFTGEDRILVNSPKVYTYDLAPGMSSPEITDRCIEAVKQKKYDFICLNYAAPDIVGHTGNFNAVVKTCEIVDSCTEKLCKELLQSDYQIIIIADHGNADYMKNDDGTANTAHSLALVPCFLLGKKNNSLKLRDGSLADIAPTILELMGITKPEEMTGKSLIV